MKLALFDCKCVAHDIHATSKKQLLQEMSQLASKCAGVAQANIPVRDILSAVLERERLGTTGIGNGVAIPHARITGLTQMSAAFARLDSPIEYDAVDDRPIDLVVMLLAPENAGAEHLRALAQVSRLLRREDTRDQLRAAPNAEAIYTMLSESQATNAA